MILVPVDGSLGATHALDCACGFGKLLRTEVHVCHVSGEAPLETDAIFAAARAVGRKHQLNVFCHRTIGSPADAILQVAADSRADLLVMGTHGRSSSRASVLGSVAEAVTQKSPIPVLLLKDPAT